MSDDDLSPRQIIEQALAKHEDVTFKKLDIPPFGCPDCAAELLIDKVSIRVNVAGHTVLENPHILIQNTGTDPFPGFDGVGRDELIQEVVRLRRNLKHATAAIEAFQSGTRPARNWLRKSWDFWHSA